MRADPAMLGVSGHERLPADIYETVDPRCLAALLSVWTPHAEIWEPAAGNGRLVRGLEERGYRVFPSDIVDRGTVPGLRRCDFLAHSMAPTLELMGFMGRPYSIVTNPPYSEQDEFVARALKMTIWSCGSVAMLLRHEWSCARSRHVFLNHPAYDAKVTLTFRPFWFEPEAGKRGASPRHNYAWHIWDWSRPPGSPRDLYAHAERRKA